MLDCSFCEFSSNYVNSMKHHVEAFHKKIHKCEQCDKVMTKRMLINHCERAHGRKSRSQGEINASSDAYSSDERGKTDKSGSGVSDHVDGIPDTPKMIMSEPAASPKAECDFPDGADETSKPETEDTQGVDDVETELKCSICAFTTLNSLSLKYHVVVFHKKKVDCDHCPLVMTKHDLIQHVAKEHVSTTGPEALAPKDPDTSSGLGPEVSETDDPNPSSVRDVFDGSSNAKDLKCSYCEYAATNVPRLGDHVLRLHAKKYHCNHCSAVMTKFELIDHSKNIHGVSLRTRGRGSHLKEARQDLTDNAVSTGHKASKSYGVEEPGSAPQSMSDDAGAALIFKCTFCDYSNPRRAGLNDHEFRLHTKKYHCNQCPIIMTKYELIEHCQADHGKTIKATGRCGLKAARQGPNAAAVPKSRSSENSLSTVQDQGSFEQGKATKCPVCDYASPLLVNVEGHIIRMHTTKYSCTFCGKIMTKYEIIEHSKEVHGVVLNAKQSLHFRKVRSGPPESPSELCARDANRSSARIRPSSKGSTASSRKFACSLCKFSSQSLVGLYKHKECFHKKTSRMRRRGAAIRNAGRVPRTNPARQLTKKFRKGVSHSVSNAGGFQSELELRIRDRPGPSSASLVPTAVLEGKMMKFGCKICEFSSRSKYSLKDHTKRIHTVKYTCSYCPVVKTKFGLIKHCKLKHGVVMNVRGGNFLFSKFNSNSGGEVISEYPSEYILKHASEEVRKSFSTEVTAPSCEEAAKESESRVAAVETMKRGLLKCKTCDWQTAREYLLLRHEAKHAPLECPICGLEFINGYSFAAHLTTHNHPKSLYRCFYCGHIAKYLTNLWAHLSHHVEALNKQDCPECEFSCFRPDRFRAHFATHTKIVEACFSDASNVGPSESFSVSSKDPSKIANVCQTDVRDTSELSTLEPKVLLSPLKIRFLESRAAVVNADHPPPAFEVVDHELSKMSIDRSELSKFEIGKAIPEETLSLSGLAGSSYAKNYHSGLLRCHNCSYATKRKSLMRRHVKLHLPEGQFMCPKCDFRDSKTRTFAKHLTSHALPGAAMQCCFCSFSTTQMTGMQQHLCIHRPVGSFYCSKCEFSCGRISSLNIHYKRHHVRKYVCPNCPKVATTFVLSKHLKKCHPQLKLKDFTHFRALTQKPIRKNNSFQRSIATLAFRDRISEQELKCKTCEFKTLREDLLQQHEAKHVPLECPVCDTQFTKGYSFTVHLSHHNPQEEPFKCFYCGDVLQHLGELYQHLSVHLSALKAHDCSLCEFSGLRQDDLELHIMSTHAKKQIHTKIEVSPLKIQNSSTDAQSQLSATLKP